MKRRIGQFGVLLLLTTISVSAADGVISSSREPSICADALESFGHTGWWRRLVARSKLLEIAGDGGHFVFGAETILPQFIRSVDALADVNSTNARFLQKFIKRAYRSVFKHQLNRDFTVVRAAAVTAIKLIENEIYTPAAFHILLAYVREILPREQFCPEIPLKRLEDALIQQSMRDKGAVVFNDVKRAYEDAREIRFVERGENVSIVDDFFFHFVSRWAGSGHPWFRSRAIDYLMNSTNHGFEPAFKAVQAYLRSHPGDRYFAQRAAIAIAEYHAIIDDE